VAMVESVLPVEGSMVPNTAAAVSVANQAYITFCL
jgi:hypothetical protein